MGESAFVDAPDGTRLHYEDHSGPLPETVVLVHGTSGNTRFWDLLVPVLADEFRVICVDLPGCGASGAPGAEADYTVERFADYVVACLDDAGVERAHVAGHSLGGAVAMAMAIGHPHRLHTLQIHSSFATSDEVRLRTFTEPMVQFAASGDLRGALRFGLGLIASNEYLETRKPDAVARVISDTFLRRTRPTVPHVYRGLVHAGSHVQLADRLSNISVPTLVTVGRDDILDPPRHSRAIAEAIPGASLVEFEGPRASHCVPVEMSEEFGSVVADFLATSSTGLMSRVNQRKEQS